MSTEPEFLPPEPPSELEPPVFPETPHPEMPAGSGFPAYSGPPQAPPKRAGHIPNLGHTILFIVVVAGVLILTEFATFAFAMGAHLFGKEAPQQLLREPRLLIPSMAISYILAGAIAWGMFTSLWQESFPLGVRWNSFFVRRRFPLLLVLGVLLSGAVQLLSNYLPIPKALPIDDFFRTPADVWLVAIFGTFLAPPFEELVFRGFMLPSFATAWDWSLRRENSATSLIGKDGATLSRAGRDPRWSSGALVFSSIVTSVFFAMVHADQLAHSWVPLSILFAVSIVLCVVRLRAHSLAASAMVHATYNGTIFVAIFIATNGFRHLDKLGQ